MPLMKRKFYSMLFGGTLTMIVVSVLVMSDSLIAGIFIGQEAVAGITLATPIYNLSVFLGSVFSLGVPIVYSAEMGKFSRKEADRVFGLSLLMSLVIGAVLFVVISWFGESFLNAFHPLPDVLEQAREFLFWMRFTMLLLPLNQLLSSMVYADGDEKISAIANIVQGAGNIGASVLLGMQMGVRGISLAGFLFTAISLGVMFLHFMKKSNSLRLNLYFSFSLLKRVFRYSLIDASSYLFMAVFTAAMNYFVTSQFGAEYLILVSAVALCREFQMVFDGIGEAFTPIISVYLAEECSAGIRFIYKLSEKTAVLEGIVVAGILILIAPLIPDILDISDPEMIRFTVSGIRILAFGSPFVSLLYLIPSYDLLIDRILPGLEVSAVRDILIPVPLAVLLGILFGPNGFFAGLMAASFAAWIVTVVVQRLRYRDDAPLFLGKIEKEKESLLYDLTVEPYSIQRVRDEIGEALEAHSYDHSTVFRVMLLFEELFMLFHDKNEGREIRGECALILEGKMIRMITRDTGVVFNPTDDDMAITSLGTHVLLCMADQVSDRRNHLVTMSFNRTVFEIRALKQETQAG